MVNNSSAQKLVINKNDLWLCKTSYVESSGAEMRCQEAYITVIVMEPDELNGEEFVRIQPISNQIEFRTEEDILIEDESILGYQFIIETWNEQPMLTKLLDKKLGRVEDLSIQVSEPDEYSNEQLDFRKNEIRRTAFLRQSVISIISTAGVKEGKKISIFRAARLLSYAAVLLGVVLTVWQPHKLNSNEFVAKYNREYNYQFETTNSSMVRGDVVKLSPFNQQESEILTLALQKFNHKDFKSAATLFEKVNGLERNETVLLYSAIAQLNIGDYALSIDKLEQLKDSDSESLQQDVLYNLVVAYAANGQEVKARRLLKALQALNPKYIESQPEINKDMRWF